MLSSTNTKHLAELEQYVRGAKSWPHAQGDTDVSDFYTPESDVVETLADGRTMLLAPAGVPVPMHIARERGFVKASGTSGPTETKHVTNEGILVTPETAQALTENQSGILASGLVAPTLQQPSTNAVNNQVAEADNQRSEPIVSQAVYDKLAQAGYTDPDTISCASDDDLLAVEGIGEATLAKLRAVHPAKE